MLDYLILRVLELMSTSIMFSGDTKVLHYYIAQARRGRREPSEKIGTCVKSLQRERGGGGELRTAAELMRLAPPILAAASAREQEVRGGGGGRSSTHTLSLSPIRSRSPRYQVSKKDL